jgi:hypothetical protein
VAEGIDSLAQEIRRVDGAHSLGAGALSEALQPWLAAHDREVAAKALRDAADEAQQGFVDEQQGIGFARVRTDWLRARADRIESQAIERGAGDGEQ